MEYLQVKNWESFQHYKDRNPPWIKLYNHLLDDFDFSCLPDASKAHLLSIWLLASRTENKIPNNSGWIGNKINATEEVNIELLVKLGFLEVNGSKNSKLQTSEQDASKVIHSAVQDACTEKRERESRVEGEGAKATSSKKFIKPTIEDVFAYMQERNHNSRDEAERFFDYWESIGWVRNRTPMKNWKASVRTWLKNAKPVPTNKPNSVPEPTHDRLQDFDLL